MFSLRDVTIKMDLIANNVKRLHNHEILSIGVVVQAYFTPKRRCTYDFQGSKFNFVDG
jgi:hypothetical protein